MAEGLVFNIIEKLIGMLGSMGVEAWNMRDDLKKLEDNMAEIKAVVLDAEEQQRTNHQVRLWLEKLKDALYDAEDLFDDVSTEGLRREVITRGKKAKKVRIFFSSSNQLVFSFKMAQKIKEIKKRIEALNVDKRVFNFTNRTPEQRVLRQRETHSFIREEEVIGREKEKKELVELLLNTDVNVAENVSIISIIGIGGLGKTALAQLVYNHKAVQEHFVLKKWVCVSDDFDVKAIAAKIIDSKTNDDMDQVQQELRKKVEGRRYLLVLDDLWNENRRFWLMLKTLLMDGAKGSKIIITTRSETVAEISDTSSPFFLKGLDEEQSWKLFSKLAWNGKEPENQNLVPIGKEIVKKCSGVPLAIRSIGSLMFSKETENEWLNFKDKDLVKIDEQGENVVLQLIKLSYDHLPFHLKKCFSFCSLFPKDYTITKLQLIRLWMAQGFIIQSKGESTSLEDIGNVYFTNLAHRSFFQDFKKDSFVGHIWWCKMHDLMHDLAKLVSGNDCVIVNKKGQHINKQTRHLSFDFLLDSSWKVPSFPHEAHKLRTFLLPLQRQAYGEQSLEEFAFNIIVSSFKLLRVLDLNNLNSRKMPSCIGMLKHLRYLDLCHNKRIEVLPSSITKLNNLQTLLLNGCSKLRELPKGFWKLTSLQCLKLEGCAKLSFMPHGIGQLTNLQTLTMFVLDRTSKHSAGARELGGLNNLRGSLEIKGLECLRRNLTEVRDINLMGKPHLDELVLIWDKQIDANDSDMDQDNTILQDLLPHHNKKYLQISGFGGVAISSSINSFTNLLHIGLAGCKRLQCLPQLHLLLLLKSLVLSQLPSLEWIANNGSNDGSSTFFPSLKFLVLFELNNLKGWCRCSNKGMLRGCCHQFKSSLEELRIVNCPNLTSVPQHTDIEHIPLKNVSEKILLQAVNHSSVRSLEIIGINDLKSLSGVLQHLTMLRRLYISNCKELDLCNDEDGCYSMQWKELKNLRWLEIGSIPKTEYLPEGLQHVTTLETLHIEDCANLTYIPGWVTSLQVVKIKKCPQLTYLPEGVKVEED